MLSSSSWCGRVGHLIGFIPLNRIPLLLPGEQTPGEHGHRGLAVPHKHVNTAWFHWGTFMCLWPYTLPAWLFDAVGKAGRLFSSAFLPGDSYLCCLFSQSVLAGRAGQCRPPSVLPHSTTLLLPCGGFAMWRNWHRDKITLVLFSDLKECNLAALTNLLTWQMLLLTSPCNPALCLFLSLHPAGHRLTMRALVRCHRAMKQKSSSSGRLAQVRHGPEPHSLGRDLLRKGEGGTNLLPSILLSSHKWGAGAPHFCVLRECVWAGLGIISGFTWISEAVAAQLRIHICGRS